MTKEFYKRTLDLHMASGDALCMNKVNPTYVEFVSFLKKKLKKEDDPDKGKQFYPAKEGYPIFTAQMKA